MAKATVKPPAKASASREVAVKKSTPPAQANLPSYLAKYKEDVGKGVSKAAEDNIVPFVSIIQTLSPQLKKTHEKFIKGAEAGDILLKGAAHPLVKAEEGLTVQPCAFQRCWVEWVPRAKGGGFVARHDRKPVDVVERPNPEDPNRTKLYRKNGNEILETRYHFVLIDGHRYVIPFVSSGHTVSKEWTTNMNVQVETLGVAGFALFYKLVPKLRTKGDNEWFLFSYEFLEDTYATEEEYLAGKAFYEAVEAGTVAAEDHEDERDDDTDNDSGI